MFNIIYMTHQAFMAHLVWYGENLKLTLEEEQNNFIQRPKLSKNMQYEQKPEGTYLILISEHDFLPNDLGIVK